MMASLITREELGSAERESEREVLKPNEGKVLSIQGLFSSPFSVEEEAVF